MKKITLLLLGLMMMTSASATEYEYVPLVREGVVWEYVGYNSVLKFKTGEEVQLYTLEFNGTTEITDVNGQASIYHNLYRTNYDEQGNVQEPYLAAYVKEEDKVVTAIGVNYWLGCWLPDSVYDFSKPMFIPTIDFFYHEGELEYPYPYNIDNSTPIELEIAGTTRKGYHIICGNISNPLVEDFKIIEGIGVDCGFGDLLMTYRPFTTGIPALRYVDFGDEMAGLSAVYENGEMVYKGCLYDEAQKLKNTDAISTVAGDRQAHSVRYYNLAGVESAEPQPGISIKVTTWSDGTRTSEKVVR
jgi:hypothetical protein